MSKRMPRKPRQSCEFCEEGVQCRHCGARLSPAPKMLTPRDYTLMLALLDGSDRKYAPKVLDTVQTVMGYKSRDSAKGGLQRLRKKLRHLHQVAGEKPVKPEEQALPDDPGKAQEALRQQAMRGEITWEEAISKIEELDE